MPLVPHLSVCPLPTDTPCPSFKHTRTVTPLLREARTEVRRPVPTRLRAPQRCATAIIIWQSGARDSDLAPPKTGSRRPPSRGRLVARIAMFRHIVRFLCCVEKRGKGDTFSSHGKNKNTLKARFFKVEPVCTKYFELAPIAKEEEDGEEENEVQESDEEADVEVMPQQRKSRRLSSISEGENE